MTATAKKTKEQPFKLFRELQFTAPPVLFDADAEQVIPFTDRRSTRKGVVSSRAAHKLKALGDERFMQREREFAEQKKNRRSQDASVGLADAAPTESLWADIVTERIGYVPRDDWKERTKSVDKINVVSALLTMTHVADEAEEVDGGALLIDEDEKICLAFQVFFGGILLQDWKEWLTTGIVPSNVTLTPDSHDSIITLLEKDISPSMLLDVKFYFVEPSKAQTDEAISLLMGSPDRSKLASSTRDKKLDAEKWLGLFENTTDGSEGYLNRVPLWHKLAAVQTFFTQEIARLGESVKD